MPASPRRSRQIRQAGDRGQEHRKAFGDRKIVDGFSIRVQRGDRIGIVGPNGAGKTTLIDMLTGGSPPDSGTIRLGANIEMATLDQHRESLDPKSTLADALTGGGGDHVMVGGKPKHVVSYMKDFLFAQEQMRTPLEVLSGGERGRLMLARALAKPSNLLVLDEPTNDLDLETLDVLEEMLGDYEGTVILISHDRDFLDRVVTSVIAPEGDGRWIEYAGGYTDMLAQRARTGDGRSEPLCARSRGLQPARRRDGKTALQPDQDGRGVAGARNAAGRAGRLRSSRGSLFLDSSVCRHAA
jgi:ATPase subunit of ABC transporter with duplicated ATPase domains